MPEKARELVAQLGLNYDVEGDTFAYGDVMAPSRYKFAIGAYEGGFGLVHERLFGVVGDPSNALLDKILQLYPAHNILAIELTSGYTSYGYAIYKNTTLIRAMAGSCDEPISKDIGELLSEEQIYFSRSALDASELIASDSSEGEAQPFDPSEYGEDLVFSVAGRFLGDEVAAKPDDTEGPVMQVFKIAVPPRK